MLEDSLVFDARYKTYPVCSSPILSFFLQSWNCTKIVSCLYVQMYVYRRRHLHLVVSFACLFVENCFFLCLGSFETDDDDAF